MYMQAVRNMHLCKLRGMNIYIYIYIYIYIWTNHVTNANTELRCMYTLCICVTCFFPCRCGKISQANYVLW